MLEREALAKAAITWKKLMENDCREWKLTIVHPNRKDLTWRSAMRSTMSQLASYLEGAH